MPAAQVPEEMTEDEINKKVHELLGNCWHDVIDYEEKRDYVELRCEKCGKEFSITDWVRRMNLWPIWPSEKGEKPKRFGWRGPDYCNDLNLAWELIARCGVDREKIPRKNPQLTAKETAKAICLWFIHTMGG